MGFKTKIAKGLADKFGDKQIKQMTESQFSKFKQQYPHLESLTSYGLSKQLAHDMDYVLKRFPDLQSNLHKLDSTMIDRFSRLEGLNDAEKAMFKRIATARRNREAALEKTEAEAQQIKDRLKHEKQQVEKGTTAAYTKDVDPESGEITRDVTLTENKPKPKKKTVREHIEDANNAAEETNAYKEHQKKVGTLK